MSESINTENNHTGNLHVNALGRTRRQGACRYTKSTGKMAGGSTVEMHGRYVCASRWEFQGAWVASIGCYVLDIRMGFDALKFVIPGASLARLVMSLISA